MGTKNRERRAAKAKQRAREQARRRDRRDRDPWTAPFSAAERVHFALLGAVDARVRGDEPRAAMFIEVLAEGDASLVVREAAAEFRRAIPGLWDAGWQPTELVRQARRSSARAGRLVAAAVLADHAHRAPSTLHPQWAEQVDAIASSHDTARRAPSGADWLAAVCAREALAGAALAAALIEALAAVFGVGALPVILPPPGQRRDATESRRQAADDPVLTKVRALLAKAESTPFEAEAEAFTAKAQELMARHAIDVALVWEQAGRDERPVTIRLPVDEPYTDAKSLLLHVVAEHSRCRAVIHTRYALCAVVGFASDVAATEVLFTSLLVQSQIAVQAEAAAAAPGSRVRSRSFRSSFLLAYANRIGERLAEVNRAVESDMAETRGGALLPVLVARSGAVDEAIEEVFGDLQVTLVRGGDDLVGQARGRAAADRAQLSFGDLGAA